MDNLLSTMDAPSLERLAEYSAGFATDFPRSKPARWSAVYLQGLLREGERKSIGAMARRVDLPPDLPSKTPGQALQQFINQSRWDEQQLLRHYRAMMLKTFAVSEGAFVVRDACFPKQGVRSVGVAKQECDHRQKLVNCQIAVSIHYVSRAISFPLALHLYLPRSWLENPKRLEDACVPVRERREVSKEQIALNLLDRLRAEGFSGPVVAAEEYGRSGELPRGLDRRGLTYLVGVRPQTVNVSRAALEAAATQCRWPALATVWRDRAPRYDSGRFACLPFASKEQQRDADDSAAELELLLTEEQADGKWRFALSNLSASTACARAAELWRSLDVAQEDYRLMRAELGLTHFEGRSWRGFHHHACMVFLAFGFLALERQRRANP